MKFDPEIARRICEEMGIEFNEHGCGITIAGRPIPPDFSAAKLLAGEYNDEKETPD